MSLSEEFNKSSNDDYSLDQFWKNHEAGAYTLCGIDPADYLCGVEIGKDRIDELLEQDALERRLQPRRAALGRSPS